MSDGERILAEWSDPTWGIGSRKVGPYTGPVHEDPIEQTLAEWAAFKEEAERSRNEPQLPHRSSGCSPHSVV